MLHNNVVMNHRPLSTKEKMSYFAKKQHILYLNNQLE